MRADCQPCGVGEDWGTSMINVGGVSVAAGTGVIVGVGGVPVTVGGTAV